MPVDAPRPSLRAVLIAVAAVPLLGLVTVVSSDSSLSTLANASNRHLPMAYDRETVAAISRQAQATRRQEAADWYRGAVTYDERTRASRGQPRGALPEDSGSARFWRPTGGTLTQPFHPGHDGIDIGVPVGTPVLAAADGTVTFAGQESGYGTHVEVRHADGTVTTYSHLSAVDVLVGQPVLAGQQIAQSGNTGHSTGPHLHFEVHPTPTSLTDPLAWLQARGAW